MPKKLTFTKDETNLNIIATAPDGGSSIESSTVEALLLFDIRYLLNEMRIGLIDLRHNIE